MDEANSMDATTGSFNIWFTGVLKCRLQQICFIAFVALVSGKEYELITEAHAQLSVVGNCSRFSLPMYCCPPPSSPHPLLLLTTPHPPAVSPPPETHRERIWSSFGRQKV
jgi:hypothetical protein